jgi:lipoprotein-releasing system ATP-binding protein
MYSVEVCGVSKNFNSIDEKISILNNVNLTVKKNENIAIVGPSGCGKTTLLQIIGLIDTFNSGRLAINGEDCTSISEVKKNELLQRQISFIYQFHHLLPEFSAIENVAMPLLIAKYRKDEALHLAATLLNDIGLGDKKDRIPARLSGGEQQRVAIARALVKNPSIILADEPTGNLDPKNSDIAFNLIVEKTKQIGASLICVTHNHQLVKQFNAVYTINNCQLVSIS